MAKKGEPKTGGKHGSPIELSNVTDTELARRAAFVLARADLNKDIPI